MKKSPQKPKKKWLSETEHLILEVALIFAGVFIFRSLWMMMDSVPVLNKTLSLAVMLVLGVLVTVICFDLIFRHDH